MKICFELKPDEARDFYDALFRSVSVDNVDVFDSSVCPDEPIPQDFSDEIDAEDRVVSDEDVHQYRLFSDQVDDDFDDDTPLFYTQQAVTVGDHSLLLSLSLLSDFRVRFIAYDTEDDCDVRDICVESVHDLLPAVRCSALYPYVKMMHDNALDYIRTERGGLS